MNHINRIDPPARPDYETAKRMAASPDTRKRVAVGSDAEAPPEILFYLASDAEAEVRAGVAGNRSTPHQADRVLAGDIAEMVRCRLATKIARLVADTVPDQQDETYQASLAVLDILVADQVESVRAIIAYTLKECSTAPAIAINMLARDAELSVSAPVLEHSPVLTDADLLSIIAASPIPGALAAIARRETVREPVSDAIGKKAGGKQAGKGTSSDDDDDDPIAALLANPSAQIREETLDHLLRTAPDKPAWHLPLVMRPKLPRGIAKKIAGFVAGHLLSKLSARTDLDRDTITAVNKIVTKRIKTEALALKDEKGDKSDRGGAGGAPVKEYTPNEAIAHAQKLKAAGTLVEAEVLKTAASNAILARAELAVLANMPMNLVGTVLTSHSAKGITALVWKAGLTMLAAMKLQTSLGGIPASKTLSPDRNGGYPLTPDAMKWQLEFLTGWDEG